MPQFIPFIVGTSAVASVVAPPVIAAQQQKKAVKAQTQAIQAQTETTERLAAETRADQARLEEESKASQKQLAEAPGIAAEEARQESMRRRRTRTRTLLTGPMGDVGSSESMRKVLLGS